jgi:hypothetical protein
MRVAVLADIHGNLPALEAVLADLLAGLPMTATLDVDGSGRRPAAMRPRAGTTRCCWSTELRRTDYDPSGAAARLATSPWSRAAWWAETYVRHRASDVEALEVFTRITEGQRAAQ